MEHLFADVLLPLSAPPYTFAVPESLRPTIEEGCAVAVPLGMRKIYTGIVWRLHDTPPERGTVKSIIRQLYPHRMVPRSQMELWRWMSDYYMCTAGEVMRVALPSMMKAEGFSVSEFDADVFSPRTQPVVSLNPAIGGKERLDEILGSLSRARKQRAAIEDIVERVGLENIFSGYVPRSQIALSSAQLSALCDKGILTVRNLCLRQESVRPVFDLPVLTPAQREALERMDSLFESKNTVLLHGVMSSGKSEVFLTRAAQTLSSGGDVLILLPEISVTAQFADRVRKMFGESVMLYHSRLTDRARAQAYVDIMRAETPRIVVGVRSAMFLPLKSLKLIVVDEEHDSSYKQQDPAPRYNARDAAQMLARFSGAKTILSSATPSLESYSNAASGRYGLVRLSERYGNSPSPQIVVSDTLRSVKRGERKLHFNKELLDAMSAAVDSGRQLLLFQNRRGMAPYVECAECGWSARCSWCGVAMSLHSDGLRCHYCGRTSPVPASCPSCGKHSVRPCGFGTEKIEQSLSDLMPFARVARLDRDTATSSAAYARMIGDFEKGNTDILVGTQIVSKGFDFEKLSVVGVLNADNLLNFPDFRASERAFATLTQISGRAGRRSERGEVVIQTSQKDNPVIGYVVSGDYDAFAQYALRERAVFGYPPYSRLVSVSVRHKDRNICMKASQEAARRLRAVFGGGVLGPQAPIVEFVAGKYCQVIMIKIGRSSSHSAACGRLAQIIRAVADDADFKGVAVVPDVDPQ